MASGEGLDASVACLLKGRLVAFPTETVWGLAARADSDAALLRLAQSKKRSREQPMAVLVPGPACLEDLGFDVSPLAKQMIDRHWPGPLTLVLRCRRAWGRGVARADGAVGVRCSSHSAASALAQASFDAGVGPITATSLNRSGERPAVTHAQALEVCEDLGVGGDISVYHGGFEAGGDPPSTVWDLSGSLPKLLRAGSVSIALSEDGMRMEAKHEESD